MAVVPKQPVDHLVLRLAPRREALPVQPLHLQRPEQRLGAGVDAPLQALTLLCQAGRIDSFKSAKISGYSSRTM